MTRIIVIGLLFLLICFLALAQDSRPLVLVFDLETTHLSDDEMTVLVDYIASNLLNTGAYRVIDRRQREDALTEISFANSDLSDDELRIKVGEFLAASYLLDGSIGVIGDRFLLNLKLVDVNTAETLKTASQRYVGINELIDDSARLTLGLIGASAPRATSTAPPVAATPSAPVAKPEAPQQPALAAGEQRVGLFIHSPEGILTDTRTGLFWAAAFAEDLPYADAEAYVANLRLGALDGWRLPNETELQSLAETLMAMNGQPELTRVVELLGTESKTRSFRGDTLDTFWTQSAVNGGDKMYAYEMGVVLMGNHRLKGHIGRKVTAAKRLQLEARAVHP